MFKPTNPDIDTERLQARARIELDRPPYSKGEGTGETAEGAAVEPPEIPAADPVLRLKRRLKAVPGLGPVLVRVNAWQRRVGLRDRLHASPAIGPLIRWSKSFALLTRTRHRANLSEEEVRALRAEVPELREELARLRAEMNDFKPEDVQARIDALAAEQRGVVDQVAHLEGLHEQLRSEQLDRAAAQAEHGDRLDALEQKNRDLERGIHDRVHWNDLRPELDAIKGEYRGRAEELSSLLRHYGDRLSRLTQRADLLHGDVLFQQRRLDALMPSGEAAPSDTSSEANASEDKSLGLSAPEAHVSDRLANVYEAFEDHFRGSRAEIKERQRVYIDTVRAAAAGSSTRPLLDVGCGRGEWLELLRDTGLDARGIDINRMAVNICREHELDARVADLFDALNDATPGGLGAVTAFHVIEHMDLDTLVAFLDAAREALAPDGVLILETPNPENLIVGAHTFHNDPTHKAPIPPAVGRFLVTQRGFADAAIWRLNPRPESEWLPGDDEATGRLNELLFGPQDYAVVARRP